MREWRSATYAGRMSIQQQVADAATRARAASRVLALATRAEKDAALTVIADALTTHETVILAANAVAFAGLATLLRRGALSASGDGQARRRR